MNNDRGERESHFSGIHVVPVLSYYPFSYYCSSLGWAQATGLYLKFAIYYWAKENPPVAHTHTHTLHEFLDIQTALLYFTFPIKIYYEMDYINVGFGTLGSIVCAVIYNQW